MTKKAGYTYILASGRNGTLYVGVTSDLTKRIYEHKHKLADGFTKKYGVDKLVYFEQREEITSAIEREKELKRYRRAKKIELIESKNPQWIDLYNSIISQ